MRFDDFKGERDPLDLFGSYIDYKAAEEKDGTIQIPFRRRPLLGRIKRVPKVIRHNWRVTKGASVKDRITFVWGMIKILLR